jgi:hypothetical protein
MPRHQNAQRSVKGRRDATSQNPQQDCCGILTPDILFKIAGSAPSVLSAHCLTVRPDRAVSELLDGTGAAATCNIVQSNAAEGRDVTGDTALCLVAAVGILGPTGLHF